MSKKIIVALVASVILTSVHMAEAQQAKVPRIGVLLPSNPAATGHFLEAFRRGLREQGYLEGKNFTIDARYGEARAERLPTLAGELVSLKVDVILTATDRAVAAVKQRIFTIPIVMANSTDPVAGLGLSRASRTPAAMSPASAPSLPELSGKRLELLGGGRPQALPSGVYLESGRPGCRARVQRGGGRGTFVARAASTR